MSAVTTAAHANEMAPTTATGPRLPALASCTMSSVPSSSAFDLVPLRMKNMALTPMVKPTMSGNAYLARWKLVAASLSTS